MVTIRPLDGCIALATLALAAALVLSQSADAVAVDVPQRETPIALPLGVRASDRLDDTTILWLPHEVARWSALISDAAHRHGLDPALVAIVVLVESYGDPAATSRAGAMGLMQVMPFHFGPGVDPYDPAMNVEVGCAYLAKQAAAFGIASDPDWQTTVERAAVAYNGGPGTALDWLAGAALPAETARYRYWVGGMWRERHDTTSATYQAWKRAAGRG